MAGTIASVASALPETSGSQEEIWDERFRHHYGEDAAAKRVWMRCGVGRRYGVVDPIAEGVAEWGTGKRMERFVAEALPLGRRAVEDALAAASVAPEEVDLLTVVSCTGYATPGLDILLARELGMRRRRRAPAHRAHGLLRGHSRPRHGRGLGDRARPRSPSSSASS